MRGIAFPLFAGLMLLILVPSSEAQDETVGEGQHRLVLYAEARTATSGPFLSTESSAGVAEKYTGLGPETGPASWAGATAGLRPAPVVFTLEKPLDRTYWLNLTDRVFGTVYWQSTSTTTAGFEDAMILVEVWVGGTIIGGGQGVASWLGVIARPPWISIPLKFRSEVAVLEPGDVLSLKIYRLHSHADFTVGTGGTSQTRVEFHYFDRDPLASGVYLEDGKVIPVAGASGSGDGEARRSGLAMMAGLGLAPLALVTLPGAPRRRVAALAVALILSMGFAGCLSESRTGAAANDEEAAPTASAETTSKPDEVLRAAGHGAVEGYVVDGDSGGIPLGGAHIAFMGTSLFGDTDAKGHYEFANVSEGRYRMRVDAVGFPSFEKDLDVAVGQRVWVNVTLVLPSVKSSDDKAHSHDLWGGAVKKELFQTDVTPSSYVVATGSAGWYCTSMVACETRVPMPEDALVLPGSTLVEVVLDWPTTGGAPTEFGLRVVTPGDQTAAQTFVQRGPKVAFRIPFFPNEADAGHQQVTGWEFFLRTPATSSIFWPMGPTWAATQKVHVTATIHKGVVPLEPAHRAFWDGAESIVLFTGAKESYGTVCCAANAFPGKAVWIPEKGLFVPPGAATVKGTFSWTGGTTPVANWKLAYRSADMPSGTWKLAPMTPKGGNAFDFTIDVKAGMNDQFYQTVSYWKFAVDDDIPPEAKPYLQYNYSYGTTWTLDATVYRDPAYVE